MLWQQALAAGRTTEARRMAKHAISELQTLEEDFDFHWPIRNKGTTKKCSPFFQWRIADYRRGILHFPPEVAAIQKRSTSAD
jgi:hypothetical protein